MEDELVGDASKPDEENEDAPEDENPPQEIDQFDLLISQDRPPREPSPELQLTDEQLEIMERNRLLAAERRRVKLEEDTKRKIDEITNEEMLENENITEQEQILAEIEKEQLEMMEKNRLLAAERRRTRLEAHAKEKSVLEEQEVTESDLNCTENSILEKDLIMETENSIRDKIISQNLENTMEVITEISESSERENFNSEALAIEENSLGFQEMETVIIGKENLTPVVTTEEETMETEATILD